MSISVTVSGEDSTSVVLAQSSSDSVTVSGVSAIEVTVTSGDAATVTVSTGDPVTITGNYSNYVTGDVVRPNQISDFLTSAQISSNINSAIDSLIDSAPDALNTLNELAAALNDDENFGSDTIVSISNLNSATGQLSTATGLLVQKSETGIFYTNDNPSGFITGVDLSDLEAATGNLDSRITSNDGDISTLQTATGLLVQKSETGSFISESQTGQFYASSNPSGFITGVDLSYLETATGNLDSRITSNDGDISNLQTATGLLVQKTETGNFVTTFDTGAFYAASNPSGFITGVDLSSYVQSSETGNFITDSDTGAFYPTSNPSGFITGVDLSSYVQDSETGLFLVSGEDAVVNNLTTSGNVGIGTDIPSSKLQVVGGNIEVGENGENIDRKITIHSQNAANKRAEIGYQGGTFGIRPQIGNQTFVFGSTSINDMRFEATASAGVIKFSTSGTERLRIDADGNVGIGTDTPSAKLDVSGDASIDGILTLIDQGNDDLKTITANNNDLTFASVHGIFGYSIGLRGNRGSILGMESAGSILDISAPSDITLTPGGDTEIQSDLTVNGDTLISGDLTVTNRLYLPDSDGIFDHYIIAERPDQSVGGLRFYGGNQLQAEISNGGVASNGFRRLTSNTTFRVQPDPGSNSNGMLVEYAGTKSNSGTFSLMTIGDNSPTLSNSGGIQRSLSITPTYNQTSSTASNTDLFINRTETSIGSGDQFLIQAQTDGVDKFTINSSGDVTVGKITLSENSFVTETGNFSLSSVHRGATVLLQNSSPITVTIPAQVSGHTTTFIAETSNAVLFTTGAGISGLNSFGGANQIAGIFGQAQVIFKSPEYAFLGGNIS